MRRDDVVAILLDTKNEVKRATDQLEIRVGEVDRDLREALTTGLANLRDSELTPLRTSQQETRTSAYNAGRKANEAITAITELRGRVDQLHTSMQDLRTDVGEVLQLLRDSGPVREPVPAGAGLSEVGASFPTQRPAPAVEEAPVSVAHALAGTEEEQAPVSSEPSVSSESSDAQPPVSAPLDQEQSREEPDSVTAQPDSVTPQKEREADLADLTREPSPFSNSGLTYAILRSSAVASATMACHRDTWDFVAAQASSHPHFRAPDLEDRGDGLVAAALSGRSLTAVLLTLHHCAEQPVFTHDADQLVRQADWAMASRVYRQITEALTTLLPGEGDPLHVVIDNRIPTTLAAS